ncbi:MOSC domain-containing protein [Pseudonocardia autotrophica]|uniref:MOSC domain protein n=3 Tax=Pseudonocardiaceae TaxID=2070 RepID=A0A1Y2MIW9_PSEAH|nr:MOSC domain protein [Pseudonocardia autotrophica]TDN76992.1 MOSC domain-containing protein [Pseudonocardia autotrophica]BBG00996.1 sulfurase [Pseudonocardia autotrophica]GEC29137.1 sulfurase [Pseudonocardia saturnea]
MRVAAVHVAPERGAPMRAVEQVEAFAGQGLAGDRYLGTRHRHVTVQSRTELDAAAEALGAPVEPGRTRRNITVDRGAIPTEPGTRIVVGGPDGVLLEVVRRAAPCRVMETAVGPGARRALHDRGGAVCRVLTSGTIAPGDPVTVARTGITRS